MGILTIARFLFGDRQAILDIAASRHAIWLGLLFVLSAGFAREYDGEDLLHEPWHLLLPLAASLTTATILFAIMWVVLHGWRTMPNEWRTYQSFLTLYWMTAPLAWIYAIPVERMFPAGEATQANLWFLGIVALWRVLLMMRVVSVIFDAHIIRVLFPFMLFADGVLLTLLSIIPTPVLAIMGGVRLSESDRVIAGMTLISTVLGTLSMPVWAIGSLIALCTPSRTERLARFSVLTEKPLHASLWGLAAVSLAIWGLVLPFTQPEQQRRWEVEQRMEAGDIAAAIQCMSQHTQKEFPPHWDPPPRLGEMRGMAVSPSQKLPLIGVMEELDRHPDVAPWVREMYARKFNDHFDSDWGASAFWDQLARDGQMDRYLNYLERHPLPEDIRRWQWEALTYLTSNQSAEQAARMRKAFGMDEAVPSQDEQPNSEPTPPKPDDSPQTPPAAESKDDGNGVETPADKGVDR